MTNAYAPKTFEEMLAGGSNPVVETPEKSSKPQKAPSAFRTISEVAEELDVQQHVLRFWETKFNQVRPLKRGGGRRYYRPEDVELLKRIYHLLYEQGYTIKGVQKLMKTQGKAQIIESTPVPTPPPAPVAKMASPVASVTGQIAPAVSRRMSDNQKELLQSMLEDLKGLRDILKGN